MLDMTAIRRPCNTPRLTLPARSAMAVSSAPRHAYILPSDQPWDNTDHRQCPLRACSAPVSIRFKRARGGEDLPIMGPERAAAP